jgi:hypothetical protein
MGLRGPIADIETRFGLAGLELYIAVANNLPFDPSTPLAKELAVFLAGKRPMTVEMLRVLTLLKDTSVLLGTAKSEPSESEANGRLDLGS